MYYAALVMAEALGPSNAAQVLDLEANAGNEFTPAYAIYEDGNPVRLLLFNYITDSSGVNDIIVNIALGAATPGQVKIKCVARPLPSLAPFEREVANGFPSGTQASRSIFCLPEGQLPLGWPGSYHPSLSNYNPLPMMADIWIQLRVGRPTSRLRND